MLRESFKYLDLDWGITVPWNAIPWTQMGEKDHDLDLVREWGIIPALLKPMKNLKVVVLLGKGYAWTHEKEIHSLCPDVDILTAPHPGNQGLIPKWGLSRPELINWLREELEAAKEYAEEDLQGGEQ